PGTSKPWVAGSNPAGRAIYLFSHSALIFSCDDNVLHPAAIFPCLNDSAFKSEKYRFFPASLT
ncbi:hypothetical protein, partial [Atlantibacter hermannii]|uniref:hypothetical protein n=1 Tax=Atlantibacter hermannii TaxID=565 RepID=UPI00289B57C5